MRSMDALLSHVVDYAGLFPPASLTVRQAAENYVSYQSSDHAWALGSLVLPVAALAEFEKFASAEKIPVSVVLGSEPERELQELSRGSMSYRSFECKLPDQNRIESIAQALPPGARLFFEVSRETCSENLLSAIRRAGASAKLRTGGIVESAVPPTRDVARFIAQCAKLRLPMKTTAGLHHPLRNRYKLTYEEQSPVGTMHGFLNVMFAAALLYFGCSEANACTVLEETKPEAFSVRDDCLSWRNCRLTTDQLIEMRTHFFAGFGSCSFAEPIRESVALGWIV